MYTFFIVLVLSVIISHCFKKEWFSGTSIILSSFIAVTVSVLVSFVYFCAHYHDMPTKFQEGTPASITSCEFLNDTELDTEDVVVLCADYKENKRIRIEEQFAPDNNWILPFALPKSEKYRYELTEECYGDWKANKGNAEEGT